MWAEFIVPAEDLDRLLREAMPFTIHFGGSEAPHSLALSELTETRLVADRGLRIVCKARVAWPILGIRVPVAVNAVTILLLPTISHWPNGDVLTFRLSIEHADFAALPAVIDSRITETINAKLAENDTKLSWDFSSALTFLPRFPAALLEPLEAFAVRPAWGEVRITEQAIVYAISFRTAVVRRGEDLPTALQAPTQSAAGESPGP